MPCEYKNMFGKLGEGIHSYRIADVAVLDFGVTFVAAYILYYFFLYKYYPLSYVVIGLFLVGIVAHRFFCVRTTIDKFLFPNAK